MPAWTGFLPDRQAVNEYSSTPDASFSYECLEFNIFQFLNVTNKENVAIFEPLFSSIVLISHI